MQSIKDSSGFDALQDGNRLIGTPPQMVNSSVNFTGKNNVFFCENNVKLVNASINFKADNAIVYLSESRHGYKINLTVHNDNVFYMGKNNYINNTLNVILSEQKHLFFGNECLISHGIWIRNADPHLIYDCKSKKRINPTKSIFVGDHVWFGQSAMLLKGTAIDSGSIIGAMSVVSGKKIRHNESWAGNPVKKSKKAFSGATPAFICGHGKKPKTTKLSTRRITSINTNPTNIYLLMKSTKSLMPLSRQRKK